MAFCRFGLESGGSRVQIRPTSPAACRDMEKCVGDGQRVVTSPRPRSRVLLGMPPLGSPTVSPWPGPLPSADEVVNAAASGPGGAGWVRVASGMDLLRRHPKAP